MEVEAREKHGIIFRRHCMTVEIPLRRFFVDSIAVEV